MNKGCHNKIPGLSEHDAVMIRSKTKPLVYKQASRKVPMYNRANWQATKVEVHLEHHISNLMQIPNINISDQILESFAILYKVLFSNTSHTKPQENAVVSHEYQHILEGKSKEEQIV